MQTPTPEENVPAGRERRCAVTGATEGEARLIRFAIAPDGGVFPDVAARAPGRGVWITAQRAAVEQAVRRNAFGRSVKGQATPAPDLVERTEAALAQACLARLAMARKAGALAAGFDQVEAMLRVARPAWRIEAADGAADGRGKLDRLAYAVWVDAEGGAPPVCAAFGSEELGVALQRDRVIHAALSPGRLADRWGADLARLAGFRPLRPASWPPDPGPEPWRSGA